jgi:hypothetical protein
MNIVITRPEVEALIQQRLQTGSFASPEDVILDALRSSEARSLGVAHGPTKNGDEKAKDFVEWAKSHRETPPLSDEAVSRASLNPDRW